MFKIRDFVIIRKLPDSCEYFKKCRTYVGGYFDAHEIEYIDNISADISNVFYKHRDKFKCIQESLKIPLEDIKYAHHFIKNGVYTVLI